MSLDPTPPSLETPSAQAHGRRDTLLIDPAAIEAPEPQAPRRVRLRRIGPWLLLVIAAYYIANLAQVHLVGSSDQARSVDAIVVMGAAQYDGRPSPQLQARLDHVVELWHEGRAPIVVVTGGKQPGDRFTEAEASATYLVAHGVDQGAIISETEGRSSWESLTTVADMLDDVGARRVLLVSDPYHSLRIRLMAEDLGLVAYVSPTRTSPVEGLSAFGKEIKEAAGVSLGRIIGFDRLLSITG